MSTEAELVSGTELAQANSLSDAKEDSMPLVDDAPVHKAPVPGKDTNQSLLNM